MGDYHVHLHPHGPYAGVGPPPGQFPMDHIEAYVETALANGAEEIAFTEHLYRCVESSEILGRWWEWDGPEDLAGLTSAYVRAERSMSIDRYVQAVVAAKDRGYPVLLGLEVDYFPETAHAVAEFLAQYPFDILIASTHWLGSWGVDLPEQVHEFERRGHGRAYEDYFRVESELAASGLFDVLAHADVIKKQGIFLPQVPIDLHEDLAVAAARGGTAIEVSTAGLRQPANEMYPAVDLLERFHNHAVPITLASDAHRPDDCARDRGLALALAAEVGYTQRIAFNGRIGRMVPLT